MITNNYIFMHLFTYLSNYSISPKLSTEGRVGGCASLLRRYVTRRSAFVGYDRNATRSS